MEKHQKAFENIKGYLIESLVLITPQQGQPMKLYISTTEQNLE